MIFLDGYSLPSVSNKICSAFEIHGFYDHGVTKIRVTFFDLNGMVLYFVRILRS